MADGEADSVKPWTIKDIPPEARNTAIAAADSDRQRERSFAVVGPAVRRQADLAEIERVIAATVQLAAAGALPSKLVSRAAYALPRAELAERRGPTGSAAGRTRTAESPTQESVGPIETAINLGR